ncbi:hypothetical protein SSS_05480 [Sarcoptes scabiei]|nr:hypothetical protein SSS_05480 [Sarcoptes scabiei]
MFNLAQYVFGTSKNNNEEIIQNTKQQLIPPSPYQSSSVADDDGKQQNNPNETDFSQSIEIENDWILIDVKDSVRATSDDQLSKIADNKVNQSTVENSIANNTNEKSSDVCSDDKVQDDSNEKWLIDPPECFNQAKGKIKKNLARSAKIEKNDVEKLNNTPMEDLLIEHSSMMSVFENLFVKKPPKVAKSMTKKAPNKKSALIKKIISESNSNDSFDKENLMLQSNFPIGVANRHRKRHYRPNEVANVPMVLNAYNSNSNSKNANNLVKFSPRNGIDGNEKISKKKLITKKQHQRQNKIAVQRNGPILRQKKMFLQFNGVYYNRNNC